MKYIFHTTKGIEEIAQHEIGSVGVNILEINTKQLVGECRVDPDVLKVLRTVDDIGVVLTRFSCSGEKDLVQRIVDSDFSAIAKALTSLRTVEERFSITISHFKSPLNMKLLKLELSDAFSKRHQMKYSEEDHSNFDLRLNIEEDEVTVSVRLFEAPLHERDYISSNYIGSLRSTVAAAMVYLLWSKIGYPQPNTLSVVDTFCGSGTILCEGSSRGFQVFGSDKDAHAVRIAKEHLQNQSGAIWEVSTQNAFSTKWPDNHFDLAISNPPWDEQLAVASVTELYSKSLQELSRILKPEGSVCFIVKKPDLFIKYFRKYFPDHFVESKQISFHGQQPTLVTGVVSD